MPAVTGGVPSAEYLSQHCGEILAEFEKIVETKSLGTGE